MKVRLVTTTTAERLADSLRRTPPRTLPIICASEPLRVLYLLVAEPDVPDSNGMTMAADVIARAAHNFSASHGPLTMDHRVHPQGWPDGVDAIVSSPGGKSRVDEVRFDSRSWSEERARDWLDANGFERGIIDDGAKHPELVESAIAPMDLTSMHGQKLDKPVVAGSWYVGARVDEADWADRAEFTGASLGGSAAIE